MKLLLVLYAIVVTLFAISKKIGILAIIMYMAERGDKFPDDDEMKKYTTMAWKKFLHIRSNF